MPAYGCYTLDCYCDRDNPDHSPVEFPHQFTHELGSVCRRQARKLGWRFHRDGTASCPKCNTPEAKLKRWEEKENPTSKAAR